jgi:hypothetical protein
MPTIPSGLNSITASASTTTAVELPAIPAVRKPVRIPAKASVAAMPAQTTAPEASGAEDVERPRAQRERRPRRLADKRPRHPSLERREHHIVWVRRPPWPVFAFGMY